MVKKMTRDAHTRGARRTRDARASTTAARPTNQQKKWNNRRQTEIKQTGTFWCRPFLLSLECIRFFEKVAGLTRHGARLRV